MLSYFRWIGFFSCSIATLAWATPPSYPPPSARGDAVRAGASWSLPVEVFDSTKRLDRSLRSIQFEGLDQLTDEILRDALATSLDVLESQHPSIDDAGFRDAVTRELRRGFEYCGYAEFQLHCETRSNDNEVSRHLCFQITEGPRYRRGEINVRSQSQENDEATASIVAFVKDHLLASTFLDDEKEKPVWREDDIAWHGHRNPWTIAARVHETLRPISPQAASVDVRTEIVPGEHRIALSIVLPAGFELIRAAPADSQTLPSSEEIPAQTTLAAELSRIYRDHFQTLAVGYEIKTTFEHLQVTMSTVDQSSCLELAHDDGRFVAAVFTQPSQLLTSFRADAESVWSLPVRNSTLVVRLSEDKKRGDEFQISFQTGGQFHYENEIEDASSGFQIESNVWSKLFPPANTQQEMRGRTIVYRNGGNEIVCDEEGVPHRLTLIKSPTHQVAIERIDSASFSDTVQRLFPDGANRQWLVRGDTADATSVRTLSQTMFGDSLDLTHTEKPYWIPPEHSSIDVLGRVVLKFTRGIGLIEQDDPLTPFLDIAVLVHSKRFATIPERLDEGLAGDAGTISDAAYAWAAMQAKDYGRAQAFLDRSRVEANSLAGVRENLRRLLDRNSILGQVLAQTDFRAIAAFVMSHWNGESKWTTAGEQLTTSLPVADTDDERFENGINTLALAWSSMHAGVLDSMATYVDAKLEAEAKKAKKIAEKRKANKAKKSKSR